MPAVRTRDSAVPLDVAAGDRRVVGLGGGAAFSGHPSGAGAVVPERGVLVGVGLGVGRAALDLEDLGVAEVHGVVERVALADGSHGPDRALAPVLAVFLLEHARGAENVDRVLALRVN